MAIQNSLLQIVDNPFNLEEAKSLPAHIRFGTSSWTFPRWKELIYHHNYSNEKEFNKLSLKEYSLHPWFRTVGVDSFFYQPPSSNLLLDYASLVNKSFKWVSKVWEEITIDKFPNHPRYGEKAGRKNENFLAPDVFIEKVLSAYDKPEIKKHSGPFVFQFQPFDRFFIEESSFFYEKLENFLSKLPDSFSYAFEIRNRELLTNQYFLILNKYNATHCFNYWTNMPNIKEQMKLAAISGGLEANFFVARALSPIGVSYKESVELFKPYSELRTPYPEMRDSIKRLAKRAIELNKEAYIIVGNRIEGCAPLSINEIGVEISKDFSKSSSPNNTN